MPNYLKSWHLLAEHRSMELSWTSGCHRINLRIPNEDSGLNRMVHWTCDSTLQPADRPGNFSQNVRSRNSPRHWWNTAKSDSATRLLSTSSRTESSNPFAPVPNCPGQSPQQFPIRLGVKQRKIRRLEYFKRCELSLTKNWSSCVLLWKQLFPIPLLPAADWSS
jgi:hypothetical protein